MSVATAELPEFVVLHGVSWEEYEAVLAALPGHRLRHTYDRGTLEMRSTLYGVSWREYEALLAALPEHPLRHTYDQGTLEMMAPLKSHDWIKGVIARMIELMCANFKIPIQTIGSTTLRGQLVERGLQPDESYYIASEPLVRGKDTLDLEVDPPPDLAIEVDVTRNCLNRLSIYSALRVPEVWRHDGDRLIFYLLADSGEYVESERSRAFPILQPGDLTRFLEQRHSTDETTLVCAFADWVRQKTTQ